jgi:hypothetical protein
MARKHTTPASREAELLARIADLEVQNAQLRKAVTQLRTDLMYAAGREHAQRQLIRRQDASLKEAFGTSVVNLDGAAPGNTPVLLALVQLGANCFENATTAAVIAERLELSTRTVETSLRNLRDVNLINSCRGRGSWATEKGLAAAAKLQTKAPSNRSHFAVAAG